LSKVNKEFILDNTSTTLGVVVHNNNISDPRGSRGWCSPCTISYKFRIFIFIPIYEFLLQIHILGNTSTGRAEHVYCLNFRRCVKTNGVFQTQKPTHACIIYVTRNIFCCCLFFEYAVVLLLWVSYFLARCRTKAEDYEIY
jgi:hypothetical protein